MPFNPDITLEDIVLESLNFGRPLAPSEFFDRLEQTAKRYDVVWLASPVKSCVQRLMKEGRVKVKDHGLVKLR